MRSNPLLIAGALLTPLTVGEVQAQTAKGFSGFYGGLEGGAISYDTQITFDGVDDPAGRGGLGYGVFLGFNHFSGRWLVGLELASHGASVPNPYTFDPNIIGFSNLDLRRGVSVGLDVRAGTRIGRQFLLFGTVGYSVNQQSVRIDGVPLDEFAGGAGDKRFGAMQVGAGLEMNVFARVALRVSFRSLSGHDLSAADFGTIPTNASLTRFDVEPGQQHFFVGWRIRVRS